VINTKRNVPSQIENPFSLEQNRYCYNLVYLEDLNIQNLYWF